MRRLALLFSAALFAASATAHTSYTGYSGAPGSSGTCAGRCHGSGGGTVSAFGFPSLYTPGQQYLITVRKLSGSTISNFNASCRVGTGSTNAGTLGAGISTAAYSASGESNGIHFTSANHDSGRFIWTAPAAGTGDVRLYVAAHQGAYSGANTVITVTAQEAASAPGQVSTPDPADGAGNVFPNVMLTWQAGSGATSHDLYFGQDTTVVLVGNQTATGYDPPDQVFQAGRIYYWRVDERNDIGVTRGPLWHFTTWLPVEAATNPDPANGTTAIPVNANLSWTDGANTYTHDLYMGLTNPPQDMIWSNFLHDPLYDPPVDVLPDTVYYWQIVERNPFGEVAGPVWSFRTELPNDAHDLEPALSRDYTLGPIYPNPFNTTVTIPFVLPKSAAVTLSLYDISGRAIATLASGSFAAGVHRVTWNSAAFGSGVYFLRLRSNLGSLALKVVALK
jgi:hypothetical protein